MVAARLSSLSTKPTRVPTPPPRPLGRKARSDRPSPRATLLFFLPRHGDITPIDPVLDAIGQLCADPYAAIAAAVVDGTIQAEFGPCVPGTSLRSVMLRRL